jgi:hypothetical protein
MHVFTCVWVKMYEPSLPPHPHHLNTYIHTTHIDLAYNHRYGVKRAIGGWHLLVSQSWQGVQIHQVESLTTGLHAESWMKLRISTEQR